MKHTTKQTEADKRSQWEKSKDYTFPPQAWQNTKDKAPICPNCGQWQYYEAHGLDCFNQCAKKGLTHQ